MDVCLQFLINILFTFRLQQINFLLLPCQGCASRPLTLKGMAGAVSVGGESNPQQHKMPFLNCAEMWSSARIPKQSLGRPWADFTRASRQTRAGYQNGALNLQAMLSYRHIQ